jgi:hypothetical protein
MVETVKEKENWNTSLLSDEVEKKTNIYDDYDIIENPKTFFTETKNTIYMFSRLGTTSINDIFQSLIVDHGVHQSRPRLSRGHIIHAYLTYGNPGEHTEVNSHKPFPQTWRLEPTNRSVLQTNGKPTK